MPWDAVTAIATVILAAATVVLAAGVPLGLLRANKTLKEQKYTRFVSRYERIITHLPYNFFAREEPLDRVDEKTRVWLVAYVDLCAEELFDQQRKAIEKRVWHDWEVSMLKNLKSAPLLEILRGAKDDYPYLNEFVDTGKVPPLKPD